MPHSVKQLFGSSNEVTREVLSSIEGKPKKGGALQDVAVAEMDISVLAGDVSFIFELFEAFRNPADADVPVMDLC